MPSRQPHIDAAVVGMHAQFPDWQVHKSQHEATITCDMLQFWLRDQPLGGRYYEMTLSFRGDDVRRWNKLNKEQGISSFNIEFNPQALWREMESALANDQYVAAHAPEGLEQLISDLERMAKLAKQALNRHPARR